MEIEWLPEARRNLADQIDYIAERNPVAAVEVGDAVYVAVSRLADFPESAPRGRMPGTRELVVSGTPFIAVYRIVRGRVEILRLLHGAQMWP